MPSCSVSKASEKLAAAAALSPFPDLEELKGFHKAEAGVPHYQQQPILQG